MQSPQMSSTLTPEIAKGRAAGTDKTLSEEIETIRRQLKAAEEERASSERSIAALADAVNELKIEISKLAASRHPSGSSTPGSCTGEHHSSLGHVRSAVYLDVEPRSSPSPASRHGRDLAALRDEIEELKRELRCLNGQRHRSRDRSPSLAARCNHSSLGHVRSAVYLTDTADSEAVDAAVPSTAAPPPTAAIGDLPRTMDLASKVSSVSREEIESLTGTSTQKPAALVHIAVEDAAIGGRRYAGASLCGPPGIDMEDLRDGARWQVGEGYVRLTP
ncbi:hypothetical protein M433DRAFT_154709 [Acidomyces richmondensis BFW]|nr:MAG: hypothetical protein FE78DRAFT_88972 [Acidomyces sp. 'richmondensis']KYG45248.1 hypothetical protein M433DRAFT_154709 [Acidomyces richmondensis BFW]